MKFVDVKNDIAFRKIFGNENKKIILVSFLNAVMKLGGDEAIEDIEIINPYQLPIIKNLKASLIDIKARDKKGAIHIIEMQVALPDGLDKRLLYYASKEYSQQIESGDLYAKLKPVIFIGIFDFHFTEGTKYLSHHAVCDVESGDRIIKDMDFYFIELPKFVKPLATLEAVADKWIFFIKEAKNLAVVPENLDDEGLKAAYQGANKHSWTKDELNEYDYFAMREQDERGKITHATKQGKELAKTEIVLKLFKKGKRADEIAELLDISLGEVNKIFEQSIR